MKRNRPSQALPAVVARLAARLGATPDDRFTKVEFRQAGQLRVSENSRWLTFSASQWVNLCEPGFSWRAKVGPLGALRVIDQLKSEEPLGAVELFGLIRIAQEKSSRELIKGELQRYLAEIAWAPDAILLNDHLFWKDLGADRLLVSGRVRDTEGQVLISLSKDGFIERIDAADRPRREGAGMIERPWRGVFRDYRRVVGRLIPHAAEVSWMVDGEYQCVWMGRLTSWALS